MPEMLAGDAMTEMWRGGARTEAVTPVAGVRAGFARRGLRTEMRCGSDTRWGALKVDKLTNLLR